MPASPRIAASVQKDMPIGADAVPGAPVREGAQHRLRQFVIGGDLVRRAGEHHAARRLEVGIFRAQARRAARRLPCAACPALRRESCGAPSAGDSDRDSCSTRGRLRSATRAATRCRAADAAAATAGRRSSASRPFSTRPISRMASRPSRGRLPCAARPSVSISTHSKPLCAMATCRSVGSVTTAPSARQRVTSASAPMLACSSSTTQAITSWPAASPPDSAIDARGVDHRRHAALHVLRAAAVDAAVALGRIERRLHAGHADGVDVAAEHQRPPGRAARRACRRRSGGPARRPGCRRSGPMPRIASAIVRATAASPAAPGTSDGLIESTAIRSLRSCSARSTSFSDG